jgi:hypothetical protein
MSIFVFHGCQDKKNLGQTGMMLGKYSRHHEIAGTRHGRRTPQAHGAEHLRRLLPVDSSVSHFFSARARDLERGLLN